MVNEKNSRQAVFAIILITLLSLVPLRSLKFHFDGNDFFPAGDSDLSFFQEFSRQFQTDADYNFIFISLYNKRGIFRKDFLEKTDSLTRYITKLPNIRNVYSLTSSHFIYFTEGRFEARPVIHISQPSFYRGDSINLFQSKEYRDLLVSKDGRSIAIAAFNKEHLSDQEKDDLLSSIRRKIDQLGFDQTHLTAKIRVERTYVQEIARNLRKYTGISFFLVILFLYLLFHSVRTVLVAVLAITAGIVWTLALVSVTGYSLNILSSLLPPIITVICMSTIIHISSRYSEILGTGVPIKEALRKTISDAGLATFLASLTTAIGFFTLCMTNVLPVRLFGLFAGTGIMLSFAIVLIIFHAYYSGSPVPPLTFNKVSREVWTSRLAKIHDQVMKYKYRILFGTTILSGISIYYASRIELNASLLDEIPRHNSILNDYKFIDEQFAGTRPFEMALTIRRPSESFFDLAVLKKVEETETFLKDSCGVGYIISPLSLFKGANKAYSGGKNDSFVLPDNSRDIPRYYENILQTEFGGEMERYLLPDGSRLRISGRLPDCTIKEFEALQQKFDRFYIRHGYGSTFSYRMTGPGILLDKAAYNLARNLIAGLIIAFVTIAGISLFLLRSVRMMLIVVIPNLVSLLLMAGIMGLLGIYLKADTAIIFSIAFGIAVDNSIHFLNRVRIERKLGVAIPEAIRSSYQTTGKAMFISTLVLLAGFLSLLSSSFGGVFYFGLLTSICLLSALILNLTLLPILLLLLYRRTGT